MSFTPEQLAKIRQKEAALPEALRRDSLTNYREGWFFVTLNTRGEVPVLSRICGTIDGQGSDAPHCEYTELGIKIKAAIASIPTFHKYVEIVAAEVMPEHLHILLYLHQGNKNHLGKIIGGFMSGCSHAYWDTLGIDWRKDHPTQGASALQPQPGNNTATPRKPDRDKDHTYSFRGPALFVRGYNDMEPITAEEVQIKQDYIRDQARKRLIQGDRHECFRKHWHQHSRNWTLDRVKMAICADRSFRINPEKCQMAQQNVMARLNTDEKGICLDYLGARDILAARRKLPLICHRADAALFDQQNEAVLRAAREGAVIVSAFISPREREIRDQLMVELLPFIEVMDNGFNDRYKPVNKAFYAVAENRLVQITPWKYLYQKEGMQVSREMCLVMNEMARVISGENDDWWKNNA